MLLNLPTEILLSIFSQLHQNDLVEYMLLSRHCKEIIEDHVLYRTVLVHSGAVLKRLTEKIQQRPDIADRIKKVSLILDYSRVTQNEALMAKDNFLSSLTKLKALHYNMPSYPDETPTDFPWYNQIEYISVNFLVRYSNQYISSNTYSHLTALRIPDGFPESTIFSVISAAPSLVELSVSYAVIGLVELESMHGSLPRLRSLKISRWVCNNGLESVEMVTPTQSLTEFMVSIAYDRERVGSFTYVNLLEYIRRKYPNLTTLKFRHDRLLRTITEIQHINVDGWIPFLQESRPHLKKLDVNEYQCLENNIHRSYFFFDDFFEILDAFSCKLSHLKIDCVDFRLPKKIRMSQQTLYIQTLDLFNTECRSFEWLKELRVLEKLKLHLCVYKRRMYDRVIQISDIIDNSPPTLVALSLGWIMLSKNMDHVGNSNIKKLTLNFMKLEEHPSTFISHFFPRLLKLKISCSSVSENTISLPTMELLDFQFIQESPTVRNDIILVISLKTNERCYYKFYFPYFTSQVDLKKAFPCQGYLPFKSYPVDRSNHAAPSITLICKSVKNVAFL